VKVALNGYEATFTVLDLSSRENYCCLLQKKGRKRARERKREKERKGGGGEGEKEMGQT